IAAQSSYPGFDAGHLLALKLQLPSSPYRNGDAVSQFYGRLTETIRAERGVESVGSANCRPAEGSCADWWYSIADKPAPAREDVPLTLLNTADATYFQTMHM